MDRRKSTRGPLFVGLLVFDRCDALWTLRLRRDWICWFCSRFSYRRRLAGRSRRLSTARRLRHGFRCRLWRNWLELLTVEPLVRTQSRDLVGLRSDLECLLASDPPLISGGVLNDEP